MPAEETAVITGGASGIGWEIARAFGEAGVNVVVADLQDKPRGDRPPIVEEFSTLDADILYNKTDVTDEAAVFSLFDRASEGFDTVNVLVNNAGVTQFDSVTDIQGLDWQQAIDVNLTGTFHCCKHGIPILTDHEQSAIVNIASVFGLRGGTKNFTYTATKGAIIALTRQLAVEFGADGLRANAVAPGFVETEMLAQETPDGTSEYAIQHTPLGRLADPAEIARAVRFLASEEASFITGQTIPVDGGFTA